MIHILHKFAQMSYSHSLPISLSQPLAATAPALPPSFVTPELRALLIRITNSLRRASTRLRPWHELATKTAFSRPSSLPEAASRLRRNFTYFQVNYLTVVASVLALSLLSHPFSLIALMSLLSAWIFLYLFRPSNHPVILFGHMFSDRETLGALIALTVIVVFLTSIRSLLISAALLGLVMVCVHGAFRIPEDDNFTDNQDSLGSGFFSIFSGVAD